MNQFFLVKTPHKKMRTGDKFIYKLKTPYTVIKFDGDWLVCKHGYSNPNGTHRFMAKEYNRITTLGEVIRC